MNLNEKKIRSTTSTLHYLEQPPPIVRRERQDGSATRKVQQRRAQPPSPRPPHHHAHITITPLRNVGLSFWPKYVSVISFFIQLTYIYILQLSTTTRRHATTEKKGLGQESRPKRRVERPNYAFSRWWNRRWHGFSKVCDSAMNTPTG